MRKVIEPDSNVTNSNDEIGPADMDGSVNVCAGVGMGMDGGSVPVISLDRKSVV